MENKELFSHHIFLFPFQWQFVGKEMKDKKLEERTCLKEFVKMFDDEPWTRKEYKTNTILNYNEYNYFYSMAREAMFDNGKDLDKSIISNLFYNIEPDEYYYSFKVCTDDENGIYKTYQLHIESIILHLYSTGVGVLSFHLNNRIESQSDSQDILNINQAGRRLYPPFFPIDFDVIGNQQQYEYNNFSEAVRGATKKEIATDFSLINITKVEDFSQYHNPDNFKSNPFQIPCHIKQLFGNIPLTVEKSDFKSDAKKVFINPLLDDRMYVVCWYGNTKLCNELSGDIDTKEIRNGIAVLNYETNDWWYKYIFNDQNFSTCQDHELKREQIKRHTYKRWSGYNTLFGINRYSFVCLTDTLANLKKPPINAPFLVNHMQTIYYKIAELCLVQRACILRFSDEVAGISAMDENKRFSLTSRVNNLYKQYIKFVNRIYFREVTAQEQGIEIYNMMQEHMRIEANVKNLDEEIGELHQYAILQEDQKRNNSLELLSVIGAIFIIPTFITGFYGMNILPPLKDCNYYKIIWTLFISGIVGSPVFVVLFMKTLRKKPQFWMLIIAFILILISLLSPLIIR